MARRCSKAHRSATRCIARGTRVITRRTTPLLLARATETARPRTACTAAAIAYANSGRSPRPRRQERAAIRRACRSRRGRTSTTWPIGRGFCPSLRIKRGTGRRRSSCGVSSARRIELYRRKGRLSRSSCTALTSFRGRTTSRQPPETSTAVPPSRRWPWRRPRALTGEGAASAEPSPATTSGTSGCDICDVKWLLVSSPGSRLRGRVAHAPDSCFFFCRRRQRRPRH